MPTHCLYLYNCGCENIDDDNIGDDDNNYLKFENIGDDNIGDDDNNYLKFENIGDDNNNYLKFENIGDDNIGDDNIDDDNTMTILNILICKLIHNVVRKCNYIACMKHVMHVVLRKVHILSLNVSAICANCDHVRIF